MFEATVGESACYRVAAMHTRQGLAVPSQQLTPGSAQLLRVVHSLLAQITLSVYKRR